MRMWCCWVEGGRRTIAFVATSAVLSFLHPLLARARTIGTPSVIFSPTPIAFFTCDDVSSVRTDDSASVAGHNRCLSLFSLAVSRSRELWKRE